MYPDGGFHRVGTVVVAVGRQQIELVLLTNLPITLIGVVERKAEILKRTDANVEVVPQLVPIVRLYMVTAAGG